MRRVVFALSVVFFLALFSVFKLVRSPKVTGSTAMSDRWETQHANLTEAEERDLKKLIPQTLSWIGVWLEPTNCLVNNNEVQKLDFVELYKAHVQEEIEMGVEIHERSIVVSVDSLHTSLSFGRLFNEGLSPAEYHLFCENNYKEYKEAARLQEADRPGYEETLKEQRRHSPLAAEAMDRVRAMHPLAAEDKVIKTEVRPLGIPALTGTAPEEGRELVGEERALYGRVLEVIREQTKFGCKPGELVEATIPAFNLGDPTIYVLINGPFYGGGNYIEWVDFSRDPSTGVYTAQHVKSFGLPEEISSFIPRIKKRQIARLKLKCSAD